MKIRQIRLGFLPADTILETETSASDERGNKHKINTNNLSYNIIIDSLFRWWNAVKESSPPGTASSSHKSSSKDT